MKHFKNCRKKLKLNQQLQSLMVSIVALVKRKKLSSRMMHLFYAENLSMLANRFRACFTLLEEPEVLMLWWRSLHHFTQHALLYGPLSNGDGKSLNCHVQAQETKGLKTCHDSNLIRGSLLKQLFSVSNIPIIYQMVFQIFISGLSKVKWFFIFVMCNGISHSAFCQHLRQHQGSIIASIFIWPSGSGRFLLCLQKFKWATLFKKQRKPQNLFCLFHSCKTKLWIMVTKSVSLNAGSLNKVHSSKRCLHFPASFPEPWKFAKKSARTDITKRSSVSGNIVDKFQTTFPLEQLNILAKVFKNHWKCMPELAREKGIYTEAKDNVKAGMQKHKQTL